MLLEDKICLVTGAGKGIGKAVAIKFAQEGAIVLANTRKDAGIENWSSGARLRGTIVPLSFDVTDSDAVRKAMLSVRKEYGGVDVLVNNAALISYEPLSMVSKSHLEQLFQTNVFAAFELLQIVSRMMVSKKNGSIINLASIVGEKGAAGQVAYSMTKGAVISMTKSAAKELAPFQVRINALAPGMVRTERFEKEMRERFPDVEKNIRMGRMAETDEIAEACAFLASDNARYITGQILGIDGCITL